MAPKATPERRSVALAGVEVREEGDSLRFAGHAAVFNQETDLGWFREVIHPGAFRKTIQEADVRFLFNHDPDTVMARTTNGTLRLSEDEVGLAVEADLDPADLDVQRLVPKLRSGNVSQMSFAFRAIKEEWDDTDPKRPLRAINEAALYDTSPVTFPAYEGTDAQLRAALKSFERAHGEGPEGLSTEDAIEALTNDLPSDPDRVRAVIATLEEHLRSLEPEQEPAPEGDHSETQPLWAEVALHRLALRKRMAAA